MQNPRLAGRYAKSLLDLAQEQNAVEGIYTDIIGLQKMCASSLELVSLIKSPVIKADKKQAIFKELLDGKLNATTYAFIQLLVNKGREKNLDEIINAFIEQYKVLKNIATVHLTTAAPLSPEMQQVIHNNISSQMPNATLDLHTSVNEDLIGGFTIEANNKFVDASIAYDLKAIQKQFMQNVYVPALK